MLRQSQADCPAHDNDWYALMTAHGLGAFVGWAALRADGLRLLGARGGRLPAPTLGLAIGEVGWWMMVVGVAGVVVTTLVFGFGGSWVFLYPLPFHRAGQWGDVATAFFSALGAARRRRDRRLVRLDHRDGDSARPRLGQAAASNRLGGRWASASCGRSAFASTQPVPYAGDPADGDRDRHDHRDAAARGAAGGDDRPVVRRRAAVDPLLAKNVLWWFGHPVVYLLLFPAVALYYLLIPRYARRPLVAGNIIAIGWTIAVIANVIVWAHHIYMDYPTARSRPRINTVMQPLTFALTIVSALSLYSLCCTIYSSRFDWTRQRRALVPRPGGLAARRPVGRRQRDDRAATASIHNTLWIVGHFHHMALLNIGARVRRDVRVPARAVAGSGTPSGSAAGTWC